MREKISNMPFLIYRIVSKVLKAVLSIDFSAPVIYSDIFPIISPINSANVAEDITLEQTLDFEFDGIKLRDFITTDEVKIIERIM